MSSISQRVEVGEGVPEPQVRRRIVEILAAGGLVALPTETVYGIAARADSPEALDRLRDAKSRPKELALTWHVADADALEAFPRLSPMVRRLAKRYWPGPLTLVLEGVPVGLEHCARAGWTGVRGPAHEATRAILRDLDFPAVLTSANAHGDAPACDADAVEASVGEALELIVDGGPARLAESSSVLKIGAGHFELLREGLVDLAALRETAGLRIAFVCTGNTCRSPMAEGLARRLIAERCGTSDEGIGNFGFDVSSMGAFANPGAPASRFAVKAMSRKKIDISEHRSSPLDADGVGKLDHVFCLTRGHIDAVRMRLGETPEVQVELLDPEGSDVPDPIGGTREDYRRCAAVIETAIRARLDDWA